mgnify:FL=1
MKSFYDVIGVSKDASESHIKKTYRKLSLQYHPDRNHSPDAEDKIREINEAYETIGDASRRKQYDMELSGNLFGNPFMQMYPMSQPQGVDELFSALFGGMMGNPDIHVFQSQHMQSPHMQSQHMKSQNIHIIPPVITISTTVTIEDAYTGCNIPINIHRTIQKGNTKQTETETYYIDIYQGIDDNEVITIEGKGNVIEGHHDIDGKVHKGDVKVVVSVKNDSEFVRRGLDLVYHKNISLKEALCGFSFNIDHIQGKRLAFNNNTNSSIITPNFEKKIANLGMVRGQTTGSLFVVFHIDFPTVMSTAQIESLSAIL